MLIVKTTSHQGISNGKFVFFNFETKINFFFEFKMEENIDNDNSNEFTNLSETRKKI